uniref:Tail assembly chaperone n=1 Tax=Myoviridae sp. ctq9w2 TaxID=2825177 RepID=A0A8S5PXM0_9CAUD|nr:MAG TPA: tail assembly chaperone [Myoviridae sp. ctq9w2]
MEQVKLSTGYKSIAIRDEDDDQVVTVLRINVSDARSADKFAHIIDQLNSISERCDAEMKKWKNDHEAQEMLTGDTGNDIRIALDINNIRVKYLKEIIAALDELFGDGTIRNIYGDIVPDETALFEFVEQVIPVMNNLFGRRFEQMKQKYNTRRRGDK